jgi:hypothetical protein
VLFGHRRVHTPPRLLPQLFELAEPSFPLRLPFDNELTIAALRGVVRASRPVELHHQPLTGRVEDWRTGLGRCLCSPLPRPFGCEVSQHLDRATFPVPPRRTQRADCPHCAHLFASHQELWDLSCWGDFRLGVTNSIAVEQLQVFVQPLPTPPRPAEALRRGVSRRLFLLASSRSTRASTSARTPARRSSTSTMPRCHLSSLASWKN